MIILILALVVLVVLLLAPRLKRGVRPAGKSNGSAAQSSGRMFWIVLGTVVVLMVLSGVVAQLAK